MNEPDKILDEITLKAEFRRQFKQHGREFALQVVYEMLYGAQLMCEVITEELNSERKRMEP